ncbi:PLP-dependent transferase [Delitschia confertaspora ATCC 74209]|uniref:PLP-dependent transferase n=1 Tax=Delitschia confertaspora ATCC 74209 TaxID=1513339 RepID=A0A9P4MQP6_9PLEO|nr:PLP-dependent transferase [Delitschia confertaspora ATCC 74209]
MSSSESRSLPLGSSQPPNSTHALSVSLPTWGILARYVKDDKDILETLQSDYPRQATHTTKRTQFYRHKCVRKLNDAVLARVRAPETVRCELFPSEAGMRRCSQHLRRRAGLSCPIQEVSFSSAQSESKEAGWSRFSAVLYPAEFANYAQEAWEFMGDGISSRHAEFCIERFPFMNSVSSDPSLRTLAAQDTQEVLPVSWEHTDDDTKLRIRTEIARFLTSEKASQEAVRQQDVFLYPKGMCAIGAIARSLVPESTDSSEAVIFGWPYASTPKCVQVSGYERFTFHTQGVSAELDQLESQLASGRSIACLFCEIPSNPLCATPDLHRIRRLADQYHFAVVCDDTIGTFANVDVLPYVDVIVTSLTKMFSGACDVMAGSVALNPQSPFHKTLSAKLSSNYENLVFPTDAEVLLRNCLDFQARIQKANSNGLAVANFLNTSGLISQVNYPNMVPTAPLYEQYRRSNGGYSYLLSTVFKNAEDAIVFYDTIDLCKGASCGTNFTLVLPYSQLAHAEELDWAESKGMTKHLIRFSVGIEEENALISKINQALQKVAACGNSQS